MDSQPYLHDQPPVKTLDTKTQGDAPGWQRSVRATITAGIISYCLRDIPGHSCLVSLGPHSLGFFPLPILLCVLCC